MSRIARRVAAIGGVLAVSMLGVVGTASADGTFQQCLNRAVGHNGVPPVCTQVNGRWVPSWPGDAGAPGDGIPGAFVFLFVVALLIGIGVTVWKVSTAQKLARQSGMDPGLATQMTLLTDDGLDATYLAASLRQPQVPAPGSPTESSHAATPERAASFAAERLTELKSLLDRGLVTPEEYDARRKAIIDTV